MAKRSFRGKPKKPKMKGGGAPGLGGRNPKDLMAQMQRMQDDMAKQQEELADKTTTVTAGGGAIEIEITGHQRIRKIEIDEDVIDPEDKEMLQDMLVAAVNAAIEESQAMSASAMEGVTGGLDINNMLGGLGLG